MACWMEVAFITHFIQLGRGLSILLPFLPALLLLWLYWVRFLDFWLLPVAKWTVPEKKGRLPDDLFLLKFSLLLPAFPLCGCHIARYTFIRGGSVAWGGTGEIQSRQIASPHQFWYARGKQSKKLNGMRKVCHLFISLPVRALLLHIIRRNNSQEKYLQIWSKLHHQWHSNSADLSDG